MIKNLIGKINGKQCEYKKKIIKIEFESDYNLLLNEILKFHNLTIIVSSVFQEDNKHYPQIYLYECVYKL